MRVVLSAPSSTKCRSAAARALSYLRSKQSDGGGFCFFKSRYADQPNLRDTYHATRALKVWNADIPRREELIEFLKRERKEDVDGLYYFVDAMATVGVDTPDSTTLARITGLMVTERNLSTYPETDRWLERVYRIVDLKKRFARSSPDPAISNMIQELASEGGYGETPNLRETCLSLKILALLGCPPKDFEATRGFVDNLQRADVGFADIPGTQYGNLEVLNAGIECCAHLGLPIRYEDGALAFVLACQSSDGSFSRVPVALPDIAYTHHALEALAALARHDSFDGVLNPASDV